MHWWALNGILGEAPLVVHEHDFDASDAPTHPRCSECGVAMWLVKIEKSPDGNRQHFECKACDATVVRQAPTS